MMMSPLVCSAAGDLGFLLSRVEPTLVTRQARPRHLGVLTRHTRELLVAMAGCFIAVCAVGWCR
jgi:hypothetical protein